MKSRKRAVLIRFQCVTEDRDPHYAAKCLKYCEFETICWKSAPKMKNLMKRRYSCWTSAAFGWVCHQIIDFFWEKALWYGYVYNVLHSKDYLLRDNTNEKGAHWKWNTRITTILFGRALQKLARRMKLLFKQQERCRSNSATQCSNCIVLHIN